MKCPNCGKKLSKDSAFCGQCGKQISKDGGLLEEIADKITNHLEFLGYKVTTNNDDKGNISINAINQNKNNLFIRIIKNGITVVAFFTVDKDKAEKNKSKLLEAINKMNNQALLTSFSMSEDFKSIVCGTWYPLVYNKESFGNFIDLFANDINIRFSGNNISELV